jgi:hypothetical protein
MDCVIGRNAAIEDRARPFLYNLIRRWHDTQVESSRSGRWMPPADYTLCIAADHPAVPYIKMINDGVNASPRLHGFLTLVSSDIASETWSLSPSIRRENGGE